MDRIAPKASGVACWVQVDDTGTGASVDGAVDFAVETAAAAPAPVQPRAADDLYMIFTGGTTGMPKGVMYRIGDAVTSFLTQTSMLYGLDMATRPEDGPAGATRLVAEGRSFPTLVGPPLMHGAGMWIGAMAPHLFGCPTVLMTSRNLDAEEIVRTIEAERVATMVIVGDAFARPILDAVEALGCDLSSLKLLASSGAMLSAASKERFLAAVPGLLILDLLGSSEGSMGVTTSTAETEKTTGRFRLNPGVRVVDEQLTDVVPGSGQVGTVMLTSAMVPIGYHKDPERSSRTFVEVDGVRYSLPGDMATVEEDGSIVLLGRGSACINTGGEKVYPEEVEEVLKTHPAVVDCLVFGVDDERLGQRVVAVISTSESVEPDAVVAHGRELLASYKLPRAVTVVDVVPRVPNGKADYVSARSLYAAAS